MKLILSIVLTTGIMTLLVGCEQPNNDITSPAVRPVKTLTLGRTHNLEKHTFPAIVYAFKKAELSFRVAGKIAKIDVKEGDAVNAGATLAVLDQSDFDIKLRSAKADFNRTKADYNRASSLVKKGHVSRADFDKLEANYQIAESNYHAAKKNLDYTVLKAPFSGTVAKRYIENYEDVNAMLPIVSLHDVSRLTIKVNIPQSIMIRTFREQAPPQIYAEFENVPGETFPLTIKEISTQADDKTGTYSTSLIMENPKKYNILPGMSATVTGQRDLALNPDGVKGQTFIIPPIAVVEDNEGRFVYLAVNSDKHAEKNLEKISSHDRFSVVKRSVKTGVLLKNGFEIISGLERGDHVIVAGVSQMHEGLEVRVIGESSL
jgi:RND family efflux transporter MFP subunit